MTTLTFVIDVNQNRRIVMSQFERAASGDEIEEIPNTYLSKHYAMPGLLRATTGHHSDDERLSNSAEARRK